MSTHQNSVKVKICGITQAEDADLALSYGAWALGFIFYPKSPRFVDPAVVNHILRGLPSNVKTVGVFVNPSRDELDRVVAESGISTVQLHGDETPEFCESLPYEVIKTIQAHEPAAAERFKKSKLFLVDSRHGDSYGGTGIAADWSQAAVRAREQPILLAGGLTPENIQTALLQVRPFGVDVSSGVEVSPGQKSAEKLELFFQAVREFQRQMEFQSE